MVAPIITISDFDFSDIIFLNEVDALDTSTDGKLGTLLEDPSSYEGEDWEDTAWSDLYTWYEDNYSTYSPIIDGKYACFGN